MELRYYFVLLNIMKKFLVLGQFHNLNPDLYKEINLVAQKNQKEFNTTYLREIGHENLENSLGSKISTAQYSLPLTRTTICIKA